MLRAVFTGCSWVVLFGDAFCPIYPYGQARCIYNAKAELVADLASLGLTLTASGEIVVA